MDENVFWLRLWQTVGAVLVLIIVSSQVYYSYKQVYITEMIKYGTDPMALRCMEASSSDPICLVRK